MEYDMELHQKLQIEKRKFDRACEQLLVLMREEKGLLIRWQRAARNKKRCFTYSLRLRLNVIADVKLLFHSYARKVAKRVDSLLAQQERRREELRLVEFIDADAR